MKECSGGKLTDSEDEHVSVDASGGRKCPGETKRRGIVNFGDGEVGRRIEGECQAKRGERSRWSLGRWLRIL